MPSRYTFFQWLDSIGSTTNTTISSTTNLTALTILMTTTRRITTKTLHQWWNDRSILRQFHRFSGWFLVFERFYSFTNVCNFIIIRLSQFILCKRCLFFRRDAHFFKGTYANDGSQDHFIKYNRGSTQLTDGFFLGVSLCVWLFVPQNNPYPPAIWIKCLCSWLLNLNYLNLPALSFRDYVHVI